MHKQKETKAMKKALKITGKVLLGLLILIVLFLLITTIWHHVESPKDRKRYAGAYGEYYTTVNGDKMNYTLYDSDSDKVAVLLPGFAYGSVHIPLTRLRRN